MSPDVASLPLRALSVFEVVGRLGSFTAAAQALGLTQTAVSQHMAKLEGDAGVPLVVRQHRGVALTPAGTALHAAASEGLATLVAGMAEARRIGGAGPLHLLTDFGLAYGWLMPRMAAISALLPGVEVRVATTSVAVHESDAPFDLAIMFGDGRRGGHRQTLLFPERIRPVAAPALAGAAPGMAADALAQLQLIHLTGPGADRALGWQDWFAHHGIARAPHERDLFVDHYQFALEAALAGEGACLGWTPLADAALAGGRLVALSRDTLAGPGGYHLVERTDQPLTASAARLKAWLLAEACATDPVTGDDHARHDALSEPA